MNTNALIGLAALIVVVGGGVWFFASKDANGVPTGGTEMSANGTGTFADFMMRGGTWTCTVSVNTPEAPTSGTVYLSGDHMRGEFTSYPTALNGQEVASHMIRTDGYFYTWTSLSPQGVKVMVPADTTSASPADQIINMGAEVQYDCQPWVADESQFEVPTNISFMDVSAGTMPQMPN